MILFAMLQAFHLVIIFFCPTICWGLIVYMNQVLPTNFDATNVHCNRLLKITQWQKSFHKEVYISGTLLPRLEALESAYV